MIHEDRRRAGSFGEDAEQYDRARPSYPAELIDDLVGPAVRRVLDVGCGTGIAARLFAARGCVVLGVEPDARMAALARRHGIEVAVAAFESWNPPPEPFDLVYSAQAWHWIDPVIGVAKAGRVLRPGGRFAIFWNTYVHAPEVQAAFAEVYRRHAPVLVTSSISAGSSVSPHDNVYTASLTASNLFETIDLRRYPWQRVYRRDEWLDQLPTHSNHRTLPPEILSAVLAGIGAAIDRFGGRITVDHSAGLLTVRRTLLPSSPPNTIGSEG
ncbi:MAG: methyltransferase domain-containing protein [Pseudonocardiaceae bacterium]